MRKRIVNLVVFPAAVLAAGCFPEEDSCNIKTDGIYAEYEVVRSADSVSARATFWTGERAGGTYLTLGECGDRVSVNGVRLSETGTNPKYYHAAVPVADSYEFVFSREDEDPYVSTAGTPEVVDITSPRGGESFSRTDVLDIAWEDNAEGEIELTIEGDCIHDYPTVGGADIADNGSYQVPAGAIESWTDRDDDTCDAAIMLRRVRAGSLDPDLKGKIYGVSLDEVFFDSRP